MDITEFVDSSLRISPTSEYAVSEDALLDIIDCLQYTLIGKRFRAARVQSTSIANARSQ